MTPSCTFTRVHPKNARSWLTNDQGYGCYEEMLETAEEMGQELEPHVLELADGVDFSNDDYGLELLKRALEREPVVGLWWD